MSHITNTRKKVFYKKEAGKRKAGNYYFSPKYSKKKKPSKREVVFGLLPERGVSASAMDIPRWITLFGGCPMHHWGAASFPPHQS